MSLRCLQSIVLQKPGAKFVQKSLGSRFLSSFEIPNNITKPPVASGYVDVHCHLFRKEFAGKEKAIYDKCVNAGLDYVIVNDLEPITNRQTIQLCKRNAPHYLAAVGIYPLDAICNVITDKIWTLNKPRPKKFDIGAEIAYIDHMAATKQIVAIGECGLDRHYLADDVSFAEQERVLRLCMQVAKKHSLPIILHARKAERRVFELLLEEGVEKADFHCYLGDVDLAVEIATSPGKQYYLSLPSAIAQEKKGKHMRDLVRAIPFERLLTETDSPFMGPTRDPNDPSTVTQSIEIYAKIKGVGVEKAKQTVRENFKNLFGL